MTNNTTQNDPITVIILEGNEMLRTGAITLL